MTDKENKKKLLDSLSDIGQEYEKHALEYEKECDDYWKNLSYDDQLKAFYSVVKRIHKGEIEDGGSYRWVLYDVFGFGPDAYGIGMECGYMVLHNSIMSKDEQAEYREWLYEKHGSNKIDEVTVKLKDKDETE